MAEAQEGRWEHNSSGAVALPSNTSAHGIITGNIYAILLHRLHTGLYRAMTANVGDVATTQKCIRLPDIVVTYTPDQGKDGLVPDPVVLFEVISSLASRFGNVAK